MKSKEKTEWIEYIRIHHAWERHNGAVWGTREALKVKQVPGHVNQERKCYYVLRPKSGWTSPLTMSTKIITEEVKKKTRARGESRMKIRPRKQASTQRREKGELEYEFSGD